MIKIKKIKENIVGVLGLFYLLFGIVYMLIYLCIKYDIMEKKSK